MSRVSVGELEHIPQFTGIRHTHTYVKIPTTNQTKAHLPRWSSLNPQPHRPPLRVVTKPHIESNPNTYIAGGWARHIPPCPCVAERVFVLGFVAV